MSPPALATLTYKAVERVRQRRLVVWIHYRYAQYKIESRAAAQKSLAGGSGGQRTQRSRFEFKSRDVDIDSRCARIGCTAVSAAPRGRRSGLAPARNERQFPKRFSRDGGGNSSAPRLPQHRLNPHPLRRAKLMDDDLPAACWLKAAGSQETPSTFRFSESLHTLMSRRTTELGSPFST